MRKILLGVLGLSFVIVACNESTKAISDPDLDPIKDPISVSSVEMVEMGTVGDSSHYATLTLRLGDSGRIKTKVMPLEAKDKGLRWKSSAPEVVMVDDSGSFSANSIGTTVIVAKAHNGIMGRLPVRVVDASDFSGVTGVVFGNVGERDADGDYPTKEMLTTDEPFVVEASVEPEDATNTALLWHSSHSGVATVADGVVTPVGMGYTTITATAYGNITATLLVKVSEGVADEISVHFLNVGNYLTTDGDVTTYSDVTMPWSGSLQIEATVLPQWLSDKSLTWTTQDEGVATVLDGLVQPVAAGTTKITATSASFARAEVIVNVMDDADFVAVSDLAFTNVGDVESNRYYPTKGIAIGDVAFVVDAAVSPADASNKVLTWVSSDNSIATVRNGFVRGVSEGSASITATAFGGIVATLPVIVTPAVIEGAAVHFQNAGEPRYDEGGWTTYDEMTLVVGRDYQVNTLVLPVDAPSKSLDWHTSHASIMTVDTGLITPLRAGYGEIRAQGANGAVAILPVTVLDEVDFVYATSLLFVNAGASDSAGYYRTKGMPLDGSPFTIQAMISPDNASNPVLTWFSTDETIASVRGGVVTPVGVGSAEVSATLYGSITATMPVIVTETYEPSNFVKLYGVGDFSTSEGMLSSYETLYLSMGSALRVGSEVFPLAATDKSVAWESSDTSIVDVSAGGILRPISVGTAMVMARSADGAAASLPVSVIDGEFMEVTGITMEEHYDDTINAYTKTLNYGNGAYINVDIEPADATVKTVAWSSSDSNIVSVASDGYIYARGSGGAMITGVAHNGVEVKVYINVNIIDVTAIEWKYGYDDTLLALVKPSDVISLSKFVTVYPSDASYSQLKYVLVEESSREGVGGAVVSSTGTLSGFKAYNFVKVSAKSNGGTFQEEAFILNGNLSAVVPNPQAVSSECQGYADYIVEIPVWEWVTSGHVNLNDNYLKHYNDQFYIHGMKGNPSVKIHGYYSETVTLDQENPGSVIHHYKVVYEICSDQVLTRPIVVQVGLSEYTVPKRSTTPEPEVMD